MNSRGRRDDADMELSDDDLDGLSGGIPHFDTAFGGYRELRTDKPTLPVLQDRPSNNPDFWF